MAQKGIKEIFLLYFGYLKDNRRLWTIFFTGKGETNFTDELAHFFYNWLTETGKQWASSDPDIPDKHAVVLCSWAYVALFSYWITTGLEDTEERMAETLTVFWNRFMKWEE